MSSYFLVQMGFVHNPFTCHFKMYEHRVCVCAHFNANVNPEYLFIIIIINIYVDISVCIALFEVDSSYIMLVAGANDTDRAFLIIHWALRWKTSRKQTANACSTDLLAEWDRKKIILRRDNILYFMIYMDDICITIIIIFSPEINFHSCHLYLNRQTYQFLKVKIHNLAIR